MAIVPAYEFQRPRADVSKADAELLEEIRERYTHWDMQWQKIREERNTDLKYIAGDPWTDKDRKAREDAGRPCINSDELGQYVNQCVNSVRQNKRGIQVDPQGDGSNDKSALLRQDLIRTIEYDSDAPSVYASAYQDMVEGSYSFFRICRKYVSDDFDSNNPAVFDMEISIKPIRNPNSVLFDPDCQEPDWSDAKGCFVLQRIPKKQFRRKWPKARIESFALEHLPSSSEWILQDDIIVAEYWRIETKKRVKYLLESGEVVDHPDGRPVKKKREGEEKTVAQYITNGYEILEDYDEPELGTIIPIIPMIGLERYLDEGGFSRRTLFSLVRLARDPQMSLAYLCSQEAEEAGLTPKAPFLGYKGQFDSSREQWKTITKIPHAFLEADIPDAWPAGQVPPLPTRLPYTPNFQAYEIAKDSARRAIQAAMGITPLPTTMQRANEKSGIALERIENLEALGSYHFIDGYDRALRLAGKIIDQWIPSVYFRSGRMKHLRKADDTYRQVQLNTALPYPDMKTGQPVHFPIDDVDHSITISSGPSYQSQREAVSRFLDGLIGQLPKLPIAPPQAARLLSIAIKMKDLGPKGDEMADIISPEQGSPDQSMAQLQQSQAQLQQQAILIQQLQAELQKLQVERQAKVVEGEYKLLTEKMRSEADLLVERLKVDAQMAAASIQTKTQNLSERAGLVHEANLQAKQQLHAAATQESQQEHELRLAQQEYAQQALQTQQEQQQQQASPEGEGSQE